MKTYCLLVALVLVGLPVPVTAQPSLGSPLSGLEQLKDFSTKWDSSSDPNWRNENNDKRSIDAGGTLTLAELEGPGIITHEWCTIAHKAPFSYLPADLDPSQPDITRLR